MPVLTLADRHGVANRLGGCVATPRFSLASRWHPPCSTWSHSLCTHCFSKERLMSLLAFLVIGLLAGLLARAIIPGNQSMGMLGTLLLGVVGSFVGGMLGSF